ncbi:MAG: cytochrome c3 family protein [Syntrophaceae bacterium]
MGGHRYSQSRILILFFTLVMVSCLSLLLFRDAAAADTNAPKRLSNVQAGDCAACHAGGKQVLPGKHPATKGMDLQACMACHPKDKEPITFKMPSSHAHMLTGITCQTCHGKTLPYSQVDMKTCTVCHSIEKLASVPARGTFLPNPHNSHYGTDVECSLCHHQHAKSEYMCLQCHDFKNVTPSPITPLSFLTKAPGEKAPEEKVQPKTTEVKAPAVSTKSAGPALTCKTCHIGPQYQKYFAQTKHGALQCSVCHKGITDFTKHMQGGETLQTLTCNTCHQDIQKQGFHATVTKFSCLQCHGAIHPKEAVTVKKAALKPLMPEAAPVITDCVACHSGPKFKQHFAQTPHAALGCTACHQGITDLADHMQKKKKPVLLSCSVCHQDIEKQYEKSYHALVAKISCLQCHTDIHPEKAVSAEEGKAAVIAVCTTCHSDPDTYVKKGHTAKFLAGNKDAATCDDCHGIHDTPIFAATDKGISAKKEYYTDLCVGCHREGGVAGLYGVFPMAVKTYGETYHGKVRQLGNLEKVAGCADCHPDHNILPASDPASALTPQALVKTCGKCHKGFHPRFVSYVPHPNPDDPKQFLGLYLTKIFMIALLAGVFGFFWIHVLLWWRKAYTEKSCLIKGGLLVGAVLPEGEGRQYVRRFTVRDRIMHVVLILSFFGVVVSGFPLKYPEVPWAKILIALFGGVENAGAVHRVSALGLWLLFLYTCWLSLKFLFPGFKVKGWVARLFGPESLFPRIKDFVDCWGMFKWFFNQGERPQFDRWTYWEKFDFFAVFWGMFVIGLSGIVMWIPELSSYIMPGWMINISHLAHSEEAFLAAVFIFTIHFFNNHLVPDKFPLERNIFTGSYTIEALKHERPLEFERILKENRLEEIKCPGPGTGIQLFAGVFGIASVLLGLALTVLIFWAVFTA